MEQTNLNLNKHLVIVRGGGDLASGTILKLYHAGFSVLVLESEQPSAIRRNVAFSEAVYQGSQMVEDLTCYLAKNVTEAKLFLQQGKLTMLVDAKAESIRQLRPLAVVDAILAKKNLGTTIDMAPVTVALGPGFVAGQDVAAVIETKRGHRLGRIIYEGSAAKNTGIPGIIAGFGAERVIRSPGKGILRTMCQITDIVKEGQQIAYIETATDAIPVYASLDGILRGLLRDGYPVTTGFKLADIDPRAEEYENCFTVSDKARCIAGGVLEAILYLSASK